MADSVDYVVRVELPVDRSLDEDFNRAVLIRLIACLSDCQSLEIVAETENSATIDVYPPHWVYDDEGKTKVCIKTWAKLNAERFIDRGFKAGVW